MRFRGIEVDEDGRNVRLSLSRRESQTFKTVLHSLVRRAYNSDETEQSWLTKALLTRVPSEMGDVRVGLLHTKFTIGEGTLDEIRHGMQVYGEEGIPEELSVNPNADPIKLALVAKHAGEMATQIEGFLVEQEAKDTAAQQRETQAANWYHQV